MGPPSCMQSVVDQNVVMQHMTAYETFFLTESYPVQKCIYRWYIAPLYSYFFLSIWQHVEYMTGSWSVMSRSTLMIPSNFVYI